MRFDIADDILIALVTLLRPQREIQLGKLFTEAASGSDISSGVSDEEDSQDSGAASLTSTEGNRKQTNATKRNVEGGRKGKLIFATGGVKLTSGRKILRDTRSRSVCSFSSATSGHPGQREEEIQAKSAVSQLTKRKKHRKRSGSQTDAQPLPAFVQQAAAAKCIR
ncbi:unnamed protein product [Dicrocoelium dendriticum]|nr:unnamed protein product [Dicrocoelium dendriticum]